MTRKNSHRDPIESENRRDHQGINSENEEFDFVWRESNWKFGIRGLTENE